MKNDLFTPEALQHAYRTAEDFRDTVVDVALEDTEADDAREALRELLEDPQAHIRTRRDSPETMTFGDLAALLAEKYFTPEWVEWEDCPTVDFLWQLLYVLFVCFDDRAGLPMSVRDFLQMPYDAYYRAAEQCGLPADCAEAYAAYDTDGKSTLEVYKELKKAQGEGWPLPECAQLIRLLVCPLAMMQAIPCE